MTFFRTLSPERKFGLMLAAIAVLLGLRAFRHQHQVAALLCLAWLILSIAATTFMPRLLAPLNRAWMHLGELMGKVVSPLVLGAIFFLCITPIGLIQRLCGRDPLRLKKQAVTTHWIQRTPVGPDSDSFKNQF